MYCLALATNAKRPFSGEMALCVAAGRHESTLALSQPRHDRYEGDATPPGKAPAHWSFQPPGTSRSPEARSPAGTGLFVWLLPFRSTHPGRRRRAQV